jgi:hypothetical protein
LGARAAGKALDAVGPLARPTKAADTMAGRVLQKVDNSQPGINVPTKQDLTGGADDVRSTVDDIGDGMDDYTAGGVIREGLQARKDALRAKRSAAPADLHDTALDLIADLEVKKVQFFKDYKQVLQLNTGVAIALAFLLCALAFDANERISWPYGVFFCALSLVPAPASLLFLWSRWRVETTPLVNAIDDLDAALLG